MENKVNGELYNQIINDMNDADMLLVGIGGELSSFRKSSIENMDFYRENIDSIDEDSREDFINTAKYIYAKNNQELIEVYDKLSAIIKERNYFIFTSNYDAVIYKSELNNGRIVAPCGNQFDFQCDCGAENNIVDGQEFYEKGIMAFSDNETVTSLKEYIPYCRECGKKMYPNSYKSDNYDETGYMKMWDLYNKWLQGTLNKKLLIIEIGEGFNMPNLMRWPFERIAYLNNKAKIYRINEIFPQLDEKIGDKGVSVQETAISFINNLYQHIRNHD